MKSRVILAMLLIASVMGSASSHAETSAACQPGGPAVVLEGNVGRDKDRTYEVHPFEVPPGVGRLEVSYHWEPVGKNVIDLGLWDGDGYRSPDGFRGWSGSRGGRTPEKPVYLEANAADRGYRPGPIDPGQWHVELGFASIQNDPVHWTVVVRCKSSGTAPPGPPPSWVDPEHVARPGPGWFQGDFHMHGRHSSPNGPDWDTFVAKARHQGLDFFGVTEYVTDAHWDELGAVQDRYPESLIWPGREIVTYFGHAIALGETPSTVEYRHGFEGISLADIQRDTRADGALFGIAHPAIREAALPPGYCRGCEFTLDDVIDWDAVDTFEIWTEQRYQTDPNTGRRVVNPFNQQAIDEWYALLNQGHRTTAVGGSDDKTGDHYGVPATAVYARELSRPALMEAVKAGHVYVRTEGDGPGPKMDLTAVTDDGRSAIMGDHLRTDSAAATVTIRGAVGQTLRIMRNGKEAERVPIPVDAFTYTFEMTRTDGEGPLGSFWNIETVDDIGQTMISNPIFLTESA